MARPQTCCNLAFVGKDKLAAKNFTNSNGTFTFANSYASISTCTPVIGSLSDFTNKLFLQFIKANLRA